MIFSCQMQCCVSESLRTLKVIGRNGITETDDGVQNVKDENVNGRNEPSNNHSGEIH